MASGGEGRHLDDRKQPEGKLLSRSLRCVRKVATEGILVELRHRDKHSLIHSTAMG